VQDITRFLTYELMCAKLATEFVKASHVSNNIYK